MVAATIDAHPRRRVGRSRRRSHGPPRPARLLRHRRSSSRPAPPSASSRTALGRAASPTASTPARSSTRRTRSGRCSWPCASSTTRPTSSPSVSVLRTPALRLQRRGPLPLAGAAGRPLEPRSAPLARAARGRRRRSGTPWPTSSSASRARAWLTPEPAARLARPRPSGAGSRAGRAVAARRRGTACASCSSRPGRGAEAGGRFLRDYLEWTRRQTGLTGRVAESVLEDGEAEEDGAGGGDDRGTTRATRRCGS